MTDEPTDVPHGEAKSLSRGTPLTERPARHLATVERIIAHSFGEAVAIDNLIHMLTDELWRLADSGVSIASLGVPEKLAGVMIRAIDRPSPSKR